jgi:hypothetical protein
MKYTQEKVENFGGYLVIVEFYLNKGLADSKEYNTEIKFLTKIIPCTYVILYQGHAHVIHLIYDLALYYSLYMSSSSLSHQA